jgi:hypothetical protein
VVNNVFVAYDDFANLGAQGTECFPEVLNLLLGTHDLPAGCQRLRALIKQKRAAARRMRQIDAEWEFNLLVFRWFSSGIFSLHFLAFCAGGFPTAPDSAG